MNNEVEQDTLQNKRSVMPLSLIGGGAVVSVLELLTSQALSGYAVAALLLSLCAFVMLVLDMRRTDSEDAREAEVSLEDERAAIAAQRTEVLQRFTSGIFSVWEQQLALVREQLNHQISDLSGTFTRLSEQTHSDRQKTDEITQSFNLNSNMQGEEQGSAATQEFRDKLDDTLDVLQSIMERQEKIPEQIGDLVPLTETIENMVGDVRRISEQTNLIALNAAIEAARAGEAGRGFAIVASEIRGLANAASDTAEKIMETTGAISSIVRRIADKITAEVDLNRDSAKHASEALESLENRYTDILANVFQLTDFLLQNNRMIDTEIAQALPHFQFEDRFVQMLGNMEKSMGDIGQKVSAVIGDSNVQFDDDVLTQWVHEIRRLYTTAEERNAIDEVFACSAIQGPDEAAGGDVIFL